MLMSFRKADKYLNSANGTTSYLVKTNQITYTNINGKTKVSKIALDNYISNHQFYYKELTTNKRSS